MIIIAIIVNIGIILSMKNMDVFSLFFFKIFFFFQKHPRYRSQLLANGED